MTDKPEYTDPNLEGTMDALLDICTQMDDAGLGSPRNADLVSSIKKSLKQMNWNTKQEKVKRIKAEDKVKELIQRMKELENKE